MDSGYVAFTNSEFDRWMVENGLARIDNDMAGIGRELMLMNLKLFLYETCISQSHLQPLELTVLMPESDGSP